VELRRVEVRVLGPVEVLGPSGPAPLTGARQRLVAGLLALHAGTLVSQTRLVDALWGDDVPRTANKTLHSHVARVRQVLGSCGLPDLLVTQHPGYLLQVATEAVDAGRFAGYARAGRRALAASDPRQAVEALRAGLALWRGDAFENAAPSGWATAEPVRLHELRLTALEDLLDAQLRLGEHDTAIDELGRLLVSHPVRERLVGLQMLALYRSGQRTDALAAFQDLRARLREQLGVDPGPELQRLHTSMLRDDRSLMPGAAAVPAAVGAAVPSPKPGQLPAPVGHFTGRDEELAVLRRLVGGDSGEPRIAVVCGPAGMGKTALIVQWAHEVKDHFPDGQLFLDALGHDPREALGAAEALARVLRGLGVPDARIPAQLSERTNLYRSLTRDKRVLLVLDNAAEAQDVLPLVPASPGSLLVVTSRYLLAALLTHHAVRLLGLAAFSVAEGRDLLVRVLGARRVEAEPEPVVRVVELCGGMPLALRIVAAKLATRPTIAIRELAAELTSEGRLGALAVDGDSRTVRTVFASAYHALPARAARLFRLLGLHPGGTFTIHLAAVVAGACQQQADALLGTLVNAHLVTIVETGRFRFHDLIRQYAGECARADETAQARAETIGRILDWYLFIAARTNLLVDPGRDRVRPVLRYPPPQLPFPPEAGPALSFLDGERENMAPVVAYASDNGQQTVAWQLTYLLTGFFESYGHWTERIEVCRHGLRAARRVPHPPAEGLMHSALGVAYNMTRRFEEALDHLREALRLMREYGDRRGEGHAYNNIAVAHLGLHQWDRAVAALLEALALHTADGHRWGMVLALNNIGWAYSRMRDYQTGLGYLRQGLAVAREMGNANLEAMVLQSTGEAHVEHGNHAEALRCFGAALEIGRRRGDLWCEAAVLRHIAGAHLAVGDHGAALRGFQEVLALSRSIVDINGEALALAGIGRVYRGMGDGIAAREHLLLALAVRTLTPDAVEEAELREDLRGLADRPTAHRDGETVAVGKAGAG
jgi:DNA-binding SARP family transcriptional activator